MNKLINKVLLALLLQAFGMLAMAQDNGFFTVSTIGVTMPILDNGKGFHIGVNPSYSLTPNFSIEGQISYLYTSIESSFLSGNNGVSNSINTIVGDRLYLNSSENIRRFYMILLLGGNYIALRFCSKLFFYSIY